MWRLAFVFFFSIAGHGIDALLKGGNRDVDYGGHSYTVAIYEKVEGSWELKCSGTVLDAQFILTAAHCFFDDDLILRNNPFKILSGTDDVTRQLGTQEQIEIDEIRVPRLFFNYIPEALLLADIAIAKLRQPIHYHEQSGFPNAYVKSIGLRQDNNIPTGARANVSGFGYSWLVRPFYNDEDAFRRSRYGQLFYAETDILNVTQCEDAVSAEDQAIVSWVICARVIPQYTGVQAGTCKEDAGGPLVYEGQVIGILVKSPEFCIETKTPGIYTNISHYRKFIKNALELNVTDSSMNIFTLARF